MMFGCNPEPRHVPTVTDIWNKICRRIGFPQLFPVGISVADAHLYQAQVIDELMRRMVAIEQIGLSLIAVVGDRGESRTLTKDDLPEYAGMSYEQASKTAATLIEREGWYKSFDRLAALREIMVREWQRS